MFKLGTLRTAAIAAAVTMLSAGAAVAAPYTDTVQANTGYFVPNGTDTYSSPYYRSASQDWDWTHGAIAGTFTTATLNISAFDVDAAQGEVDEIYVSDNGSWVKIGNLAGANDVYAFTNFVLTANFFDDIAAGLKVRMNIDANNAGWLVTLAKSSLSVDNGSLPNPNPGGVPEPATWAMMIIGFGAVGSMVRSSRRRTAMAAA